MLGMFRQRTLVLTLAGSVLLAAGPGAAADIPGLTTIRVVTAGQDTDAQAFYAEDLGIFKKYGIHAEIQLLRKGGGAAAVAAVAGNAADIGDGDLVAVANAREHGIPITVLAPSGGYRSSSPAIEVIVAKDSPIKSGKDLEGKTLALISVQGTSHITTTAWLEQSGAAVDKVQYVEIPPINMAAAVERGTVAGAVINEPALAAALASCCRVLANSFQSLGNAWQINGWYALNDWVTKNPDLAHKFSMAMHEAAVWGNNPANHAKSAEILNKYTPFPQELIGTMTRAVYGELVDPKTMQPILDAALKYKEIPSAMPAQQLISTAAATK
jgi:NitT/TauT family transport system substrate-binding protein